MGSQDQFTEIKVQTFPRFWDQGSVFGVKKWVSWRKRIPRYGPVKLVQRFLWFTYSHNRTDRTLTSELSLLCNIIASRKDYSIKDKKCTLKRQFLATYILYVSFTQQDPMLPYCEECSRLISILPGCKFPPVFRHRRFFPALQANSVFRASNNLHSRA